MGMELRAGRDRDSGPDRLSRLISARADTPADERDDESNDVVADRWGETAMPDWLDTRRGRQTWNARRSSGFECLDEEDAEAAVHGETGDNETAHDETGDDEYDEWEAPRRRWTMLPPAAIGLILVGLIGCGFAGYSLLKQNEPATPLVAFDATAGSTPPSTPDVPAATSEKNTPAEVVVSVVGLVRRPGLVRLAAESRVADALARAGGTRPNADTMSLNLAQIVHDGDQILVGQKGDGQVRSAVVGSGGAAGSGGASGSGGKSGSGDSAGAGQLVNLNTATEAELDALPGVGPVTAQSIIAWREANGAFASVDQLAEVDGIGEGRLAKLRPLVAVG
ncbi:helix-hairpin-helix domain-containing protein [Gordonia sp. HY285]|uniref:Helix-hairpin-helix domain-containing protein n=1 Tax=Gordonia liuliyuniae TaxID=2911517 RepID=A0ABS9IVA2_9ACTN|nr:helix-hairpin-helix domain-containing protein [Gordonia liuliyuniae]MCF8589491.1 helix-hairpin-helix domain-containing protein [Gordonia liuliyuniae]MCF8611447.1 helix-hairpin-helix domain-containing protein [Gordonia liuliyuniae]